MILTSSSRPRSGEGSARASIKYYLPGPEAAVADAGPSPDAFRVDQRPGFVLPVHFHLVDQFQVVVAGSGHLGHDELKPLTVHYTDAATGYGPILSGADGLGYLTLRARHDTGAHWLPAERVTQRQTRQLEGVRPRHRIGHLGLDETADRAVLDAEPDGLSAYFRVVSPGGRIELGPCEGPGRYVLLVRGALDEFGPAGADEQSSDDWSFLFLSGADADRTLTARVEGAAVLIMQFPAHDQT